MPEANAFGPLETHPPALRHRGAARRGPDPDPVVLALGGHRGSARRGGGGRVMDLRRRPARAGRSQRGAAGAAARAGRARRRAPSWSAAGDRQRGRQPRVHRAHRAAEARTAGARARAGKRACGRARDGRADAHIGRTSHSDARHLPVQGRAGRPAGRIPVPAAALTPTDRRGRDFSGRLELVVSLQEGGRML